MFMHVDRRDHQHRGGERQHQAALPDHQIETPRSARCRPPSAIVAHSADSSGIRKANAMPPISSSTTSAPTMYGGRCLTVLVEHAGDHVGVDLDAGEHFRHRRGAQVLQARRGGADDARSCPSAVRARRAP